MNGAGGRSRRDRQKDRVQVSSVLGLSRLQLLFLLLVRDGRVFAVCFRLVQERRFQIPVTAGIFVRGTDVVIKNVAVILGCQLVFARTVKGQDGFVSVGSSRFC